MNKNAIRVLTTVICLFVFCCLLTACGSSNREQIQPEVQIEKDNTNHEHSWGEVENAEESLVKTVQLQSFACDGVESVYLIRYRFNLWNTINDYYIACDENFNDFELAARHYKIVIEYLSEGDARVEKHENLKVSCSECGEHKVQEGYTYRFYIPEGSYLVRFE